AGFQVDALGPGDTVDEWERVQQFAVGRVGDVEEPVTVGVSAGLVELAFLVDVIEQHDLVVTGEIPGVVGCVLIEPLNLAGSRIHANLTGGVEAVVVLGIAVGRGAGPAIPGRRVARADNDGIGLRIESGALPGGAAAVTPGL